MIDVACQVLIGLKKGNWPRECEIAKDYTFEMGLNNNRNPFIMYF